MNADRTDYRALVIGAGRMGLTHIALFNMLSDFRIRWTVVEPSRVVRAGLRFALSRSMLEVSAAEVDTRWQDFDFALITSPTSAHAAAYRQVSGIASKIFVEKPLAVDSPSPQTLCGYVLLHHPLHKMMKQQLAGRRLVDVEVQLRSNTVLAPNTGWRSKIATGGGVINEFGSHAFSLLVDLAGAIRSVRVGQQIIRYSIDAPDVAVLTGTTREGAHFKVMLDWTDATVRKPTYSVKAVLDDGAEFTNDLYEFVSPGNRVSVADFPSECGSYLRGIEFTNQARHFLDNRSFADQLAVAVEVDRILGELRDYPR